MRWRVAGVRGRRRVSGFDEAPRSNDVTGVWESVAIPCAEGLIAYAQGRFADAAEAIGPVLRRLHLVGGSHAQRDVFVQTWIDASLRSGRHSAVAQRARHARAHEAEGSRALEATGRSGCLIPH